MELRQYWNIIWRWMWLIVLSTGIAAVSSFLATRNAPKVYQASTTLMVGQTLQTSDPSSMDIYTSQQLATTYVQIAKMENVLQGTLDALGLGLSPAQLRPNVSATVIQGTQLLELKVVDTEPARAQAIANEMAHQLILQGPAAKDQEEATRRDFVRKQADDLQKKLEDGQKQIEQLQSSIQVTSSAREIADKQQQIATLQSQINQWQTTYVGMLNSLGSRSPNYLSVIETAQLPTTPVSASATTTILLAAAIGMALAVGAAFLLEYLDDTLKTPDDVTEVVQLPILGIIARIAGEKPDDKLIVARHPRSSHAEAYRVLRANLEVADVDHPVKTLLVTSANPVEGKSVTAANMAAVIAQAGHKVVLVDSDMRRPSQHRIFKLSRQFGLTDILRQADPVLDEYIQPTEIENLRVIATGQNPPNPAELLGSKRMQSLIEMLKRDNDMVIFDTPPCLPLADATILSRYVDGVILVLDAGRTRRDSALRAKNALERGGARILGAMLNRVNPRGDSYYYYYYYYYSSEGEKQKRRSKRSRGSLITDALDNLFQRTGVNQDEG